MRLILISSPLLDFYLITLTFALMQFVLRFMIVGGSKPSESIYSFGLFVYGTYIGNIIFLFPIFFWFKFNFWIGIVSLIYILITYFIVPILIIKVSKFKIVLQLIHLYNRIGFILIPYLIYLILEFDYSGITV
jgi:hypothetical protein